jgi:hypothetical protein
MIGQCLFGMECTGFTGESLDDYLGIFVDQNGHLFDGSVVYRYF